MSLRPGLDGNICLSLHRKKSVFWVPTVSNWCSVQSAAGLSVRAGTCLAPHRSVGADGEVAGVNVE